MLVICVLISAVHKRYQRRFPLLNFYCSEVTVSEMDAWYMNETTMKVHVILSIRNKY